MKSDSALRRFEIPGTAVFEAGEGNLIRLAVRSALARTSPISSRTMPRPSCS
jgi:hypothetical protein